MSVEASSSALPPAKKSKKSKKSKDVAAGPATTEEGEVVNKNKRHRKDKRELLSSLRYERATKELMPGLSVGHG